MHKLRDIGIAALLAALSMQALAASGAEPQALVTIDTGKLRGQVEDALAVYRGVPFAAPPIGDLRWRAPQPAAKWDGVKEALKFGPRCQQLPLETAPWLSRGMVVSEDCLTLNVWGPKDTKKKVPVMVWIHGGAFTMGAGSEAPYQGQHLAGRGVVVVTINYRLGALGYFAHPALSNEDSMVAKSIERWRRGATWLVARAPGVRQRVGLEMKLDHTLAKLSQV